MNSGDLSISASAAFVLQRSISSLGCLNMGPRVKLRASCWHDKHDWVISTVLKCACYHITAGSSGISCCICFTIKAKISKFTVEVERRVEEAGTPQIRDTERMRRKQCGGVFTRSFCKPNMHSYTNGLSKKHKESLLGW